MSSMRWMLWFVVALISGCTDVEPVYVDISIEPDGQDFEIRVTNKSGEMITFDDNLFGVLRDHQFTTEVRNSAGMHVELCSSIDIFTRPRTIELPTGSSTNLLIPMSFVMSSYCLKNGKSYEFRIGFTSKNRETAYSEWTPFIAVDDGDIMKKGPE